MIIPVADTLKKVSGYNKIVIEIDPLIEDIIRSREVTKSVFVGLSHEEEVANISVGVVHVQPLQVDDYVFAETQREMQSLMWIIFKILFQVGRILADP